MHRGRVLWAGASDGFGASARVDEEVGGQGDAASPTDVVQAILSWRDARSSTVLGVEDVKAGKTLALGEKGDLLVPSEVLGAERVEILRYENGKATALIPPSAKARVDGWDRTDPSCEIELARGHAVEILVGAFVVRLARVRALRRPAAAPLETLRGSNLGAFAGSALFHGAAFAFVALLAPSLGATEEDPYDRDRIALMQKLLDASAQREAERLDESSSEQTGGSQAGARAPGSEGAAGTTTPSSHAGRWAARGSARPSEVTLPRGRAIAEAGEFGVIAVLRGGLLDTTAPTASWGRELKGADDLNAVGSLYRGDIGDATGTGWSLSGPGDGSGWPSNNIAMTGFGPLDRGCARCTPGGIGIGYDKPGHGHELNPPRVGYERLDVNGRLPAELIQRVVRQNDGRYRFCYQNGLRANPALAGRVTVKFVVDRHGQVAIATDGGSDLPDASVRQCVISSFTSLSFPENASGSVTVSYPLVFSPEGS